MLPFTIRYEREEMKLLNVVCVLATALTKPSSSLCVAPQPELLPQFLPPSLLWELLLKAAAVIEKKESEQGGVFQPEEAPTSLMAALCASVRGSRCSDG